MPSLLPRTELALSDYREHIDNHPDTDQVILDCLVRYILILMCAEIEQVVTDLIRRRLAKGSDDAAIASYIQKITERNVIRNAKFREISNKVGFFGSDYQEKFIGLVSNSTKEGDIDRLGLAVGKRDQVAHKRPPSITFQELDVAYTVAKQVVEAVRLTLET